MSDLRREWPLVVFTIAVQLACGLSLVVLLADLGAGASEISRFRPLGIATFPTLLIGLLFSVIHLGRPLDAWKSLLNLRRSRLSLEVLLTFVFALLAAADSRLWFTGRTELRYALGIATALAGLAAVISSALVYMLPSQPFWNRAWVPASFIGTSLLLAGSAGAVVAPAGGRMSRLLIAAILIGSAVLLISALVMHRDRFQIAQARRHQTWFVVYAVLAGLAPPLLALISTPNTANFMAIIALFAAFMGVVMGRTLMYTLAVPRF